MCVCVRVGVCVCVCIRVCVCVCVCEREREREDPPSIVISHKCKTYFGVLFEPTHILLVIHQFT